MPSPPLTSEHDVLGIGERRRCSGCRAAASGRTAPSPRPGRPAAARRVASGRSSISAHSRRRRSRTGLSRRALQALGHGEGVDLAVVEQPAAVEVRRADAEEHVVDDHHLRVDVDAREVDDGRRRARLVLARLGAPSGVAPPLISRVSRRRARRRSGCSRGAVRRGRDRLVVDVHQLALDRQPERRRRQPGLRAEARPSTSSRRRRGEVLREHAAARRRAQVVVGQRVVAPRIADAHDARGPRRRAVRSLTKPGADDLAERLVGDRRAA